MWTRVKDNNDIISYAVIVSVSAVVATTSYKDQ